MALLSDEEIEAGLEGLAGWEHPQGALSKEYGFDSFRRSVTFVVAVAFAAEAANHHPDLDIRYNRVRVTLSTHSEGGVTAKDLELASTVEEAAGASS
jgi:4a-hydroxytetrahydrobiopterin dehydratase